MKRASRDRPASKIGWGLGLGVGLGLALACAGGGEARAQDGAPPAVAPPVVMAPPPVRVVRPSAVPDTVYLIGGGMIRGSIYEMVPNDHVGLLDYNGAAKIVRWSDVSRVVFADPAPGSAGPAAVPVPATAPLAAAKPSKVGPLVKVHIQSKRGVQLYRQPAGGGGWVEACTSPCDEEMPLGDDYRIAGAGIFQSNDFRLEGAPGSQVVLNVDPGTRSGMLLGGVLAAVGGIVDYISLFVIAAGAAQHSCSTYDSSGYYSSSSCGNGDGKSTTAVGLAMLAGGTAAIVGGVIIMIANGSTGVSQNESTAKTGSSRPIDAYRRDPMWATAGTPTTHGSAPTLSFPILSGTF